MAEITSANQLALQSKTALEATGAFVVEPDGRVRMAPNRGGGYAPPWVWAPALADDQTLRTSLSLPSSDPKSPWRTAVPYSAGGPFTKHSEWDSTNGTYDGGIDWGTLLGTVGVGALFAAPALAAAFSSSGAAATSATTATSAAGSGAGAAAGPLAAGETGMAASAASMTPPAALAATTAASSVPSWLLPALKVAAPFAIDAATRPNSSGANGSGLNGLSDEQQAMITQLLGLSVQRQQEAAPVHQAAMMLAGRLAPSGTWGNSPRFQDAVAQTGGPGSVTPVNPNIAAAYAKLMGGH